MQTEYLPQPSFRRAWRLGQGRINEVGRARLESVRRFELAMRRGLSGVDAAEVIGVPRATLFRWRKALRSGGVRGLEPRSRRPKRLRRARWDHRAMTALESLRREFPFWGKKKLTPLLRKKHPVSESTAGRMLSALVQRGVVAPVAAVTGKKKQRRRAQARPWAQRLARGQRLRGTTPGCAVQVDTLTVHPQPGIERKHFNAICTVSRWNVAGVYDRATAHTARDFLDKLLREMPFPVRGLQIDGGSEFKAEFEEACQAKNLPLHVLAPKSPELNGTVERVNRTWRDEFYDVYNDLPSTLEDLRPDVNEHQNIINTLRPHESLDLLSPAEYLARNHPEWAPQSQMY